MPRGGKIMAHGASTSQQASSSSSSRQSDVTPTIASMLQELHQLIKQTEVRNSGGQYLNSLARLRQRINLVTVLWSQTERNRGEHTLLNIGKTHQKMREELRGVV